MLLVIMHNVIMLSVIKLGVTFFIVMPYVIILSVATLNVVPPMYHFILVRIKQCSKLEHLSVLQLPT
jgi:hypothetical protein